MAILKSALKDLKPYQTNVQKPRIKLDANESKNFLFHDGFFFNGPLERYPDNEGSLLIEALAKTLQIEKEQLLIGVGSSEILEWVIKSTVEKGETILTTGPTFVMYQFFATMHECRYLEIPLKNDFSFDESAFLNALAKENPRLVILCSPNNPTGGVIASKTLEKIVTSTDALVLIDEAYIEFASGVPSWIDRVNEFSNVIVTRTFSKAYGLAGIRLGYAVANPQIITALKQAKAPFNVNALSQNIGLVAIQRYDEVLRFIEKVIATRQRFIQKIDALGIVSYPSFGNFVLIKDDHQLFEKLSEKGIAVRAFQWDHPFIRITIGDEWEMEETVKMLKEILNDL